MDSFDKNFQTPKSKLPNLKEETLVALAAWRVDELLRKELELEILKTEGGRGVGSRVHYGNRLVVWLARLVRIKSFLSTTIGRGRPGVQRALARLQGKRKRPTKVFQARRLQIGAGRQ